MTAFKKKSLDSDSTTKTFVRLFEKENLFIKIINGGSMNSVPSGVNNLLIFFSMTKYKQ